MYIVSIQKQGYEIVTGEFETKSDAYAELYSYSTAEREVYSPCIGEVLADGSITYDY